MNHIYRVVFNRALGVMQAVSETASGRRKGAGRPGGRARAGAVPGAVHWAAALMGVALLADAGAPLRAQSVLVTGTASEMPTPNPIAHWNLADDSVFSVGTGGVGTMLIQDGGTVSMGYGFVGGEGDVTVIGEGSRWRNVVQLMVGTEIGGTLTVSGGGLVEVGRWAGVESMATVMGQGSRLTSSVLHVGYNHTGRLDIENGGMASADSMVLGYRVPAAHGTVNLNGVAGARGVLQIGQISRGQGSASLNFNGGILRAARDESDFLSGLSAGQVIVSGDADLGTGGAFIDSNGFDIGIGSNLQGTGSLVKTGAGALRLSGTSVLGGHLEVREGTLDIAGGGSLANGEVRIGGAGAAAVANVSGPGSTWSGDRVLVGYDGAGELNITGGAVVTAGNVSSVGGWVDHGGSGTAMVSGSGSRWNNTYDLVVGFHGEGELTVAAGGEVNQNNGYIGSLGASGTVRVTGPGSAWISRNSLVVGYLGRGELTVDEGGTVRSAAGHIGSYDGALPGQATITGADSAWIIDDMLDVGQGGMGTLTVSAGGEVDSAGTLMLGRDATAAGTLNIGAAAGSAAAAAGVVTTPMLAFGDGMATLVFNHLGTDHVFSTPLLSAGPGTHAIDHVGGTTTLTGNGSGFAGTTTVRGGTLRVGDRDGNGSLGGIVNVLDGGTLGGSGTAGTAGRTVTVADGGRIAPGNSVGALSIAGHLALSPGSLLDFELGSPGASAAAPGASDRIDVGGNLVLDGTLNLAQSGDAADGAAGLGYYRLMTYGGSLTDNGLVIGDTPIGSAGYDVRAGDGKVDLFMAAMGDDALQHWQGGDGTWNAGGTGWLNQGGGMPVAWAGNHAAFKNEPGGFNGGTVNVDGTLGFKGLQFVDSGYRLQGAGTLAPDGSGSADGNAEIRVLAGEAAEIAASVSGADGIAKTGAGTLALTGANVLGGDVAVQDGTLVLRDGGTLASRYGLIAAGAASQAVARVEGPGSAWSSDRVTVGYDGTGELHITGGGVVNTSLAASVGGWVSHSGSGKATVSGAGSRWNNSFSLNIGRYGTGELTIANGGEVNQEHGYVGFLNTSGKVWVTGAGSKWIDRGELRVGYIGQGELTVSAGGTVRSEQGSIGTNGGAAGAATVAGQGSAWVNSADLVVGDLGKGTLTVTDGGEAAAGGAIILARNAAATGTLNVGAAAGSAAAAAGVVNASSIAFGAGAGTLVFNHTGTDQLFSRPLQSTGAGTHAIQHLAGTTTLTGDSSGFAGHTIVQGGKLRVGDAAGNGALGGSLEVRAGGTLGGSGTVGSGPGSMLVMASGGILAPGNSIGTLKVLGDLRFESGSRYEVELDPLDGRSDRIEVSGSAVLDGGAVVHVGQPGDYLLRSSYTILTAGDSLTGRFDTVSSDFAFLNAELQYDYAARKVDLALVRNDRNFDDDPPAPGPGAGPGAGPLPGAALHRLTPNQKAAARGVESLGMAAAHPVYDAVVLLPNDERLVRASFDALSGEIHASARTALIEDSRHVRKAANDRLRAAFAAPGASQAPVAAYGEGAVSRTHAGPVVWSQAFGSWGATDGDGNAATLDRDMAGLLVGADRQAGNWRVGVMGGYSHSSLKARERASSARSNSYHLGVYGGTQWGRLALRTGLAYSWHDLRSRRTAALPGLSQHLTADTKAHAFQAFGELGYGMDVGRVGLEPFVNLAHVSLHARGLRERGGTAALSGASGTTSTTFATLGARMEYRLNLGRSEASLHGMLGWRHAFGDARPESTLAIPGGSAFTVAGVPIARNSAVLEAGLDLKLSRLASLGVSYSGQLARSARDHGLRLNLGVRF